MLHTRALDAAEMQLNIGVNLAAADNDRQLNFLKMFDSRYMRDYSDVMPCGRRQQQTSIKTNMYNATVFIVAETK